MGLTSKLTTKMRTKPATSPIALPGGRWDWPAEQTTAAIVRGAAVNLASMGLQSSSFRGNDAFGIGKARSTGASTVWVEQHGLRTWSIALGRAILNYRRTLDFEVMFEVNTTAIGAEVEVSTPSVLTSDGGQGHKHQYSETRDVVTTGLAQWREPRADAEQEMTDRSLRQSPPPVITLKEGVENGVRVAATSLVADAIQARLNLLPYPCLERRANGRTVQIGVGTHTGTADILISDTGATREVTVHYALTSAGYPVEHVSNLRHALGLFSQVLRVLNSADDDAAERAL